MKALVTYLRQALPAAVAAASLLLLLGCSVPANSELGQLQTLAKSCPHAATLAAYVGDDVSGSGQSKQISTAREIALTAIVTKVAVCNGHLHVDAFTGSAAASSVVYDGTLRPAGATQISQLRKVPTLVRTTMATINTGVATATKTLAADGSDIVSQFGMASQFYNQLSGATQVQLDIDLLTDGEQNVGIDLNPTHLTVAEAEHLATRLRATPLPDSAAVKVSGLGKSAGKPPATSYIQALTGFYETYCKRTGAATCTAVTDYTA